MITQPNITGLVSLFQYANAVTGSGFWNIFMIVLWIILFGMMKAFSSERAILAASFICAVASGLLLVLGFIHPILVVVFVMATAVGALMN